MQDLPVRILLIEDDEDDYVLVRERLEDIHGTNYKLHWASNAAAALDALQGRSFDVLLMDYRLGAISGLELMTQIQARGIKTPVIVLTGQGDREIDIAAMQAGAADYLVKGRMEGSLLERAIRYALERGAALEALEYRVKLELLIATISTHFVSLQAREIDAAIDWALQEIGEFIGADRSFTFLIDATQGFITETNVWLAREAEFQLEGVPPVPISGIPWVMEQIESLQSVSIPRLAD